MIDSKKLKNWSKEIYDTATEHGWHNEYKPDGQWLALVMSEIGEAVEADRKHKRVSAANENDTAYAYQRLSEEGYKDMFVYTYDIMVKGTIEEEFADIVIRLLDFAYMKWKNGIDYSYERMYRHNECGFAEHAWYLCKEVLNSGYMNVADSIGYVMDWADDLGINLEMHIEWKMKYNSLRPYMHGGKKY